MRPRRVDRAFGSGTAPSFFVGSVAALSFAFASGCGSDGSGNVAPPTQSSTVEVPFQITTVYALEQKGDADPIARARYYDAAQVLDIWGNAGTLALSPGDGAYADGKKLDIETRTEALGTLRVDYSQTIPKGKPSYAFELRRPQETISATIPAVEAFTLQTDEFAPGQFRIEWSPIQKGAKVSVVVVAKSACAVFEEGMIESNADDRGMTTGLRSPFARRRRTASSRFRSSAGSAPPCRLAGRRDRPSCRPTKWTSSTFAPRPRRSPCRGVEALSLLPHEAGARGDIVDPCARRACRGRFRGRQHVTQLVDVCVHAKHESVDAGLEVASRPVRIRLVG